MATKELTRRDALGMIVGAGTALAFGCTATDLATSATDAAASNDAASKTDSATAAGDGGSCAVTNEGEIGPYFSDDSAAGFDRSNILTNLDGTETQTGIPFTFTINVVDTEKDCAPYVGAQLDIWHCNVSGIYSDQASESTTTMQWLRGYQLTDSNGQAKFVTIIPGWYQGRTTHIHIRVRSTYSEASSTTDETNTTQFFFDQTFLDRLATSVAPYDTEGTNPTTNASDRVYSQQTKGDNQLVLSGDDTAGYTATATIGLPITS